MDIPNMSGKKEELVITIWQYLLRHGLEHSSVGELCRETKLSQSSLYYWFDNKDDIYITAGKYGINQIVTELFKFVFEYTDDIRGFFDKLLDKVDKYKNELRLTIQIAASPVYGERMRQKAKDFKAVYAANAEKIIKCFGCSEEQAAVFIYSVITILVDYAIWDDREDSQLLLDNLYERVCRTLSCN